MDVKAFIREVKELEYHLYFHSRAHECSVDYYENLNRRLTYAKVGLTSVGAVLGGNVYLQYAKYQDFPNVGGILCLALFCSVVATHLYSMHHGPARKQSLHYMAAIKMKALQKKIAAWETTIHTTEIQPDHVSLLKQFNEFVDEQRKMEEGLIKSEDWTFTKVHEKLSNRWKKIGEELGKYFPETSE